MRRQYLLGYLYKTKKQAVLLSCRCEYDMIRLLDGEHLFRPTKFTGLRYLRIGRLGLFNIRWLLLKFDSTQPQPSHRDKLSGRFICSTFQGVEHYFSLVLLGLDPLRSIKFAFLFKEIPYIWSGISGLWILGNTRILAVRVFSVAWVDGWPVCLAIRRFEGMG